MSNSTPITRTFVCAGCGAQTTADLAHIWYAFGDACHSKDCQQQVLHAEPVRASAKAEAQAAN